jgi:hypothetical protein
VTSRRPNILSQKNDRESKIVIFVRDVKETQLSRSSTKRVATYPSVARRLCIQEYVKFNEYSFRGSHVGVCVCVDTRTDGWTERFLTALRNDLGGDK